MKLKFDLLDDKMSKKIWKTFKIIQKFNLSEEMRNNVLCRALKRLKCRKLL
jgi:hypothetical protein